MFHIACFGGAKTDSTNNENVPAVIDNALTTSANNRYISPAMVNVFAAGLSNDTINRGRITAPSLRTEGLPEVYPLSVGTTLGTNPLYAWWGMFGPTIQRNEEFGLECSNGVSTVDRANGFICFREAMRGVPNGKRMTVVGTSTQTLLQSGWTLGGITLDQVLPVGRYAVIGMHTTCNDALAARLVFPRGNTYRPGTPVSPTVGGYDLSRNFRAGALGSWGEFDSIAQPQVEIFGLVAGAETATVILDLVQVSQSLAA